MSSVTFSSDGADVITRQLEGGLSLDGASRSPEEIEAFYELERCSAFITSNDYQRVALQFPDQFLCDSGWVALRLRETTKQQIFILADTSYGSCCVDEVAAEHVAADCIVHFGPSCLTQTRRLPVLYIFGHGALNVPHCAAAFKQLFPQQETRVLVLCDTSYSHCTGSLKDLLKVNHPSCVFSSLVLPRPVSAHSPSTVSMTTRGSCEYTRDVCSSVCNSVCSEHDSGNTDDTTLVIESSPTFVPANDDTTSTHYRLGQRFVLAGPLESYQVFYVGREGSSLTNLMLSYSQCQFYSYDPVSGESRKETLNVNKALARRYYLMQRAKEASTVGILVGTLGVARYLESIQRLKQLLKSAGKKYYTIAVGKLNVPKMANFLEIDIFVLVSCPLNSLLDSREFFKPVVTPYEMEVACNRSRDWGSDYITDFSELLPGAIHHVPTDPTAETEPEYSLISGGLLPGNHTNHYGDQGGLSTALVPRSKMEVALQKSAGAHFLHSRSWQGLEQQLGQSKVTMATEGVSGVAAGYTHEPSTEN